MHPHMPPSSPRHASAKRARPRHREEPSHATTVTPCPRRVPCPPCRHALPPMQRVPSPCTRPRLGSPRSPRALERACCLGKACQWPASRLTPGAHPCLPPDVAHRKAHGCPSPPCNESPPRVLGPSSRLVEEPSSPRASMLPRKKTCQWPTSRLTPGAHPCPPLDVAHRKAHGCPSPPCNECPPRALGPVPARRGALKPSSERVASERSQTHRRHAYIGPTKASLVAPVCWSGVASGRVAVRRVMPCRSEPDGV